jgi:signal transduction histidine kinase
MSERPTRALLVDDEEMEYELMRELLPGLGSAYSLDWAPTPDAALADIDRAEHDVYLIDYRLKSGHDGLSLIREAKRRGCSAPMILLTGFDDAAVEAQALKSGAADYLVKGSFSADALARSLRYAVERARLHDMFVQAEKLSAMGLLAAGVAHELNNPLAQIIGSCELALSQVPKGGIAAENLKAIERASKRCRDLVKDLLQFARKDEPAAGSFELGACLNAALDLLEPQARLRGVTVARELRAAPARLRGRQNHLEQVLVNLFNNALDAMPSGGRLTVRSGPDDGPAARIDVIDTGAGIPDEARERLFEPFFTTKAPGKGTGLGLFLSRKIVAAYGGELRVESAPGRGTTFSVILPTGDSAG